MDFLELTKSRYSTRGYQDRAVEPEKIDYILQAALAAPTARNIQPIRIFAMHSPEGLAKAAQFSPHTFGAPLVFAVCCHRGEQVNLDINPVDFALMDASIVLTHMMLAATHLGLGSCWVGTFDDAAARAALQLPDELQLASLLVVGYADLPPSPRHTQRRSREELVTEL